ncbi:MAG: hypothetical protein KJ737_16805 [Proteobacteria bacterium]|nr:hypothetical protein [Pseudomonadota bacterium]
MTSSQLAAYLRIVEPDDKQNSFPPDFEVLISKMGITHSSDEQFIASLPFSSGDATVGVENEFQTIVIGNADSVDLPLVIQSSNFYKNTVKYATTGDSSRYLLTTLERHLSDGTTTIWENSWIRFPKKCLNPYADQTLKTDLHANKRLPGSLPRKDVGRFFFNKDGESFVRIPVSYTLKLALADAVGDDHTHPIIRHTAEKLMHHFLNDNTSPEITSFYPVESKCEGKTGEHVAKETLKRFLLTQFLIQYTNQAFQLEEHGQKAHVYFAPHPPLGQKKLNNLISDSFYRELFMSPCLSGWDQGEDKHRYMGLCHRVLSLSQLNAVGKLKEAGIITRNLVVLPNTSNTSLANNGTHVSIGSKKLGRLLSKTDTGITGADEKYIGDLVIKMMEHFLPLFAGTYSAAPYRFDFWDFHPEKMLGFLPHELDFTHLRMIWRRWRKKASIRCFGRPMTPFGPEKFDRMLSRILRLKGDFIPDVRLIDYLVSLLSTNASPAFNGLPGSDVNLKKDLADMGVFDESMPLYSLYRLRQKQQMGFSGFEGRYYSIFEDINKDMGHAVNLQHLLTVLSYKYIFERKFDHGDIPDHPTIESERRQIFFGAAIGIPTVYVWKNTKNRFMATILKHVNRTRPSKRYNGYIRVLISEYRKALIAIIRKDAKEIIEILGLEDTIVDLELRITESGTHSAEGKITRGILELAGGKDPMKMTGETFNLASETYYRTILKNRHIESAFDIFKQDVTKLDSWETWREGYYNKALLETLQGENIEQYLADIKPDLLSETLSKKNLKCMIHLILLSIHQDMKQEHAG